MSDLAPFLSSSPVFRDVPEEQVAGIASLFDRQSYPAGTVILRQGQDSPGIYFLRTGRLAVRVQRDEWRQTVAYLDPPDFFGELSFLTGRSCVADVEVELDAEVVFVSRESLSRSPDSREALLRGLTRSIAERLRQTVARGPEAIELPVVLLRNHANWEAPCSFAYELTRSLAQQTGRETVLMTLGEVRRKSDRSLGDGAKCQDLRINGTAENLRSRVAEALTNSKARFENVVLSTMGPDAAAIAETIKELTNHHGYLLGPGDAVPSAEAGREHFIVQSAARPTLPVLSGNCQLIFDAAESESAQSAGGTVSARFRRTVDSIARSIVGLQVGLALGGGAAWGWAHIGVLDVLEQAGLPIDVISGCSMGSVIGALRSAGFTISQLKEIAHYWRTRTRRFVEWRFWHMCLLNERMVRKVFRQYFGERAVNQTEIPYWANAVDIRVGKEFTIQTGTLVDCVRASIALPGLLPPATVDSHLLVDAGIMNPVPASLVRQMGCHYAIAVNAMAEMEKQKMNSRYPFNSFDIMSRCMVVMGHEIGQARAEHSANIVFTPRLGDVSMLHFDRSPEIIECGRRAAELKLPAILAGYAHLKARASARQPAVAAQQA